MKRYYLKKEITMILFLVSIFLFGIFNAHYSFPYLMETSSLSLQQTIVETEVTMNEHVLAKYGFVEAYGYIQALLGKKEVNGFEVIKDNKDILHMQSFEDGPKDMKEVSQYTIAMYEYFKEKNIPYTVLLIPDKYITSKTHLANGYPYNYANETLDQYQKYLLNEGVPIFDIRTILENSSLKEEELFFKTDHHWRIETAFMAYQSFLDYGNAQFEWDIDPLGYYKDEANYNFITYPSIFLGSLGRKTGSIYAGSDDFTFVYPKFATDFEMTWSLYDSAFTKTGRFEVSLANPSYLQHSTMFDEKSDTYAMYLDGNASFTSIVNTKNQGDLKVLFIKDSMSLPFVAFFANTVKQTDLLDPRYFDKDLKEFIMQADYDYIFTALSESTLQSSYFPFLKSN